METSARNREWSDLPGAVPLNAEFDAERLAAEVRRLRDVQWRLNKPIDHLGLGPEHDIDWKIIPLRGPNGDPERTDPGGAGLDRHADTPHLARCPYHAEVLASLPAPLHSVRLISLGPGVSSHTHSDLKTSYPWGCLRLHIPITTHPGAWVVVDGVERHWDAGRLWFADFDRPHSVRNEGTVPRVHMVIDCVPTPAIMNLFPEDYRREMPWSDVLFTRDAVPLNEAELRSYRCSFPMPATFPEWSDPPESDPGRNLGASVDLDGDRLVLSVEGEPRFGLVHIGNGEFRLEGWTEERTVHLSPAGPSPEVTFIEREGRAMKVVSRPITDRAEEALAAAGGA